MAKSRRSLPDFEFKQEEKDICELCLREVPKGFLQHHHPLPKSKGGRTTIPVCKACHAQIHKLFTNNELRDKYSSVKKLKTSEKIKKWLKFICNTVHFRICTARKKKK